MTEAEFLADVVLEALASLDGLGQRLAAERAHLQREDDPEAVLRSSPEVRAIEDELAVAWPEYVGRRDAYRASLQPPR